MASEGRLGETGAGGEGESRVLGNGVLFGGLGIGASASSGGNSDGSLGGLLVLGDKVEYGLTDGRVDAAKFVEDVDELGHAGDLQKGDALLLQVLNAALVAVNEDNGGVDDQTFVLNAGASFQNGSAAGDHILDHQAGLSIRKDSLDLTTSSVGLALLADDQHGLIVSDSQNRGDGQRGVRYARQKVRLGQQIVAMSRDLLPHQLTQEIEDVWEADNRANVNVNGRQKTGLQLVLSELHGSNIVDLQQQRLQGSRLHRFQYVRHFSRARKGSDFNIPSSGSLNREFQPSIASETYSETRKV